MTQLVRLALLSCVFPVLAFAFGPIGQDVDIPAKIKSEISSESSDFCN